MPTPIYIMAGQSNANSLYGANGGQTLAGSLAAATGSTGIITRLVFANGAPLTFGRGDADWYNRGELPTQLLTTIRGALNADPDAYLAAVIWVQGEADTHAVARATEYGARLGALVDWLVRELAVYGDRTADFRLSLLALSAEAAEGQTRANWQTIRDQQLRIDHPRIDVTDPDTLGNVAASTNATTARSPSTGLFQSDGLHYTSGANAAILDGLTRHVPVTLSGTDGNDRLTGRWAADVLDGGAGHDRLAGGLGADTLRGGLGNDLLWGGTGQDELVGGRGADRMWGGWGADRFIFLSDTLQDRGVTDRIEDFTRGSDLIDLRQIDANTQRAGNQAFHLAAGPGDPGALWISTTMQDGVRGVMLQFDVDGDRQADGSIFVAGVSGLGLHDILF